MPHNNSYSKSVEKFNVDILNFSILLLYHFTVQKDNWFPIVTQKCVPFPMLGSPSETGYDSGHFSRDKGWIGRSAIIAGLYDCVIVF